MLSVLQGSEAIRGVAERSVSQAGDGRWRRLTRYREADQALSKRR